MTNNKDTSLIIIECFYESVDSVHVEMISGFIENHNMRLVPDEHTEGNPTLLSSTALVHGSELDISEDAELGKMASIPLDVFSGVGFLQLFQRVEFEF